jgi:hypothetical protein
MDFMLLADLIFVGGVIAFTVAFCGLIVLFYNLLGSQA